MKLYCKFCDRLVADVTGHIRKEAGMVCRECIERLRKADNTVKMAKEQEKNINHDMPDFFKGIFK